MNENLHQNLIRFPSALLSWFDLEKRNLPWRQNRTPWRVLLSEFMLQQTRVDTVIPYFEKFMQKWPDVESFASASEAEVLEYWAGLGYYSRARNLHKTSQIVRDEHGGKLPRSAAELKKLPGIGPYTAAAVASMAFGEVIPSIDGNLLRILSRLSATRWQAGNTADLKACAEMAAGLIPKDRPGDFNEAMMDLGAGICLPKNPHCSECPVHSFCSAFLKGNPEEYPLKADKSKVKEVDVHYLILRKGSEIFLRKRKERLLHDFYEFIPLEKAPTDEFTFTYNGLSIQLKPHPVGKTKHIFSHRVWHVRLYEAEIPENVLSFREPLHFEEQDPDFSWQTREDAAKKLLPPFLRPFVRSKQLC